MSHVCTAYAQQVETVTVDGNALVGVWNITWPEWGNITFLHGAKWGPMRDRFCRIEQVNRDLAIHCFAGGLAREGAVGIDGAKIHIALGNMMLRMFDDGLLLSATNFTATQGIKFSGVEYDNPGISKGTKFDPSKSALDTAGKSALLKAVLAGQPIPHDEAAIAKNGGAFPAPNALGAIQVITYLGPSPRLDGGALDFFSVYAVEFDSGERICGLHQRSDSVLDGFLCI